MDVLKQLFEQHFHHPAETVQALQGQLGGSGRSILRLTGGATGPSAFCMTFAKKMSRSLNSRDIFAATDCPFRRSMVKI